MTIFLTVGSMALALVLGLRRCRLLRTSDSRPLRFVSGAYVEFFRNTPLLVQLFFWFFALPKLPALRRCPVSATIDWLLSPLPGGDHRPDAVHRRLHHRGAAQRPARRSTRARRRRRARWA